MNEQEQPRRRRRRLYRTSADWFGLAAMGLLMICSLVLLVQLMSTKLLTDLYLILIEIVLLLINAGHVIIQLPIRRVKTGKVLCGLLAVLLSGLMLYGSVAAASGKSALLAIAGKNLQKTTSYVVVMADDPARSIGDTVGYTFGILSEDADISADNTSALLEDIKDGLGGRVDTSTLRRPDLPGGCPVRRKRRGHHPQFRLSHRPGFTGRLQHLHPGHPHHL